MEDTTATLQALSVFFYKVHSSRHAIYVPEKELGDVSVRYGMINWFL